MALLILLHVKTRGSYSHSLVIVIIQLYENPWFNFKASIKIYFKKSQLKVMNLLFWTKEKL